MKHTVKSGLTIGMLVAALAFTSGCGDNDNSGDDNDNGGPGPIRTSTPGPIRTSTPGATVPNATATPTTAGPTATATPSGAQTQAVTINFTATEGIQGFQVTVAYPTAKGSFQGAGSAVTCAITGGGSAFFTKNDKDDGDLVLSVAGAENLTFPVDIVCPFEATSTIVASDITVTVDEVTQNNASGNAAALVPAVTVADPA